MRSQTLLLAAIVPLTVTSILSAQTSRPSEGRCADPLALQVLLDRHNYSPGEIDGTFGANTTRALEAFRADNASESLSSPPNAASPAPVPTSGTAPAAPSSASRATSKGSVPGVPPDALCDAFNALGGNETEITTTYTITPADAEGLLAMKIPTELRDQASLPSLGYTSLLEKVAEKFHAAPALLTRMNKGVAIEPGATITVPNVAPFDVAAKPPKSPDPAAITVEVTREGNARATSADGRTIFFAPVSSGSEHDPLPIGQWKVNAVSWMPVFHYNPDLFWDAKATDEKATIKPGPNGPVGVVWIDISVEHYGLHGTPEPSRIGHTQSHGCVRLTNWDAARLAALVGPGTPVVFK